MKNSKLLYILAFLLIGIMTSCDPTDDQELEQNQIETFNNIGDSPSEETDEDDELEPND